MGIRDKYKNLFGMASAVSPATFGVGGLVADAITQDKEETKKTSYDNLRQFATSVAMGSFGVATAAVSSLGKDMGLNLGNLQQDEVDDTPQRDESQSKDVLDMPINKQPLTSDMYPGKNDTAYWPKANTSDLEENRRSTFDKKADAIDYKLNIIGPNQNADCITKGNIDLFLKQNNPSTPGATTVVYGNPSKIDSDAFDNVKNLDSVLIMSNKLDAIEPGTFKNRNDLTRFTSDAQVIGAEAFKDCQNLKYVDMMNVKGIGERAFDNCKDLKELYLPNAEVIGPRAFNNCTSLNKVVVNENAKIDRTAFAGCKNMNLEYLSNDNNMRTLQAQGYLQRSNEDPGMSF